MQGGPPNIQNMQPNMPEREVPLKPSTLMTFKDILCFPFRTVIVGNIFVVVYVLLLGGVSLRICSFLHATLADLTYFSHPSSGKANYILSAIRIVYLLCVPFIVAAAGLPLRIVWRHHGFHFSPLFNETFLSIKKFCRVIGYTWKNPFYYSVPLIGIALIMNLINMDKLPEHAQTLMPALLWIAGLIAFIKLGEWFFTIILASFGDLDEITALQHSKEIFGLKRVPFLFVLAVGLGLEAWIYLSGVIENDALETSVIYFILWYTTSLLVVLVLEASETAAQIRGQTFRYAKSD